MIERSLFLELKNHLSKKEISFIVGPRQAGKTTLMLFLKDYLEKKGEKTLFLNLDIEVDREYFSSQERLIKKIELELGKRKGFVFIDEIQRKQDAGVFLKGIYDMRLPYKFITSGSGSVELKERIHESLIGRKRIFELSTLSFEEFVNFRTQYKYKNRLSEFFEVEKSKTELLLEEYLNFGGYPRIVLENDLRERQKLISEIYQSYIERDISYLLKVNKTEAFTHLAKLISYQVGNIINFSELSSTVGISIKTLKDYLWYMEKTFVIQRINPYFKNIRKEITKSPVYYFYDIGLRNFAIGDFGRLKDVGFVFQNFIYNLLKEKLRVSSAKIYFWRTKDKAEVDFIVDFGKEVIPIEVKYKKMKSPELTRSLKSFIEKYAPQKAVVVNLSLDTKINLKGTQIHIIPFYRLSRLLSNKL
ncbi:MAG: ATP-binding protein [Candidatus Omnitrophica bacterium]|nr:ATP-binding protein [Candidatus Omnitrophota bacterium]